MIPQVCTGALLSCTCGLAPSALIATSRMVAHIPGVDFATVADCLPLINILPFGGCTASSNPAFPICLPVPSGPWTDGAPGVTVAGIPTLAQSAVLSCAYGGVISIVLPGSTGVLLTP